MAELAGWRVSMRWKSRLRSSRGRRVCQDSDAVLGHNDVALGVGTHLRVAESWTRVSSVRIAPRPSKSAIKARQRGASPPRGAKIITRVAARWVIGGIEFRVKAGDEGVARVERAAAPVGDELGGFGLAFHSRLVPLSPLHSPGAMFRQLSRLARFLPCGAVRRS